MFLNFLKNRVLPLLFLILVIHSMDAQDLSKYQWEHRILLVNFDEFDQQDYHEQIRELKANHTGLLERKLVVYQIRHDRFKFGLDEESEWQKISSDKFQKIKKNTKTNFSITLIGLDGGIKEQRSTVFETKELFEIIDAMPMRMRELRKLDN